VTYKGPTFADAAPQLRAQGYAPIAHAGEGCAVRCLSLTAGPLVALTVSGELDDPALEQRVLSVLGARGLTGAPVRLDADGARTWPLRLVNAVESSERPWRVLNRAVSILHTVDGRAAIISLGGEWPSGTLLEVSYAQLPAFDRRRLPELMAQLAALAPAQVRRRA
jgi:hypothetical protein